MRKVCYITGTRADFGLMSATLDAIRRHPKLDLRIVVTGMHLSTLYGETVAEVEASGAFIQARVPVPLEPTTGSTMARNIGAMITAFTAALEADRPDVVLLLGDRGEMLAGAIAGLHLNIPVAHIHGGDRSGTVDESVRHAISKLSHLHFAATENSRKRLIRMGEHAENIHVTGAPGIDGLKNSGVRDRTAFARAFGLDPQMHVSLMVYHPVLQESEAAAHDARSLFEALESCGVQVVALMPNADAGSEAVREVLSQASENAGVKVVTHLSRPAFINAMASSDLMIGNSSAGIIEAASFGTPVINVGSRQNLRERNANVMDVATDQTSLRTAISTALERGRFPAANVYGDGGASGRIVHLLASTPLGPAMLMKANSY